MPTPRDALLALLATAEGQAVLDLAAALLRLAREHLVVLDAALSALEGMRWLDAVHAATVGHFRDEGDEVLDARDVLVLTQALARLAPGDAEALVAARAMALALDEALGDTFAETLRHRGLLRLEPGSAVPHREPPLKLLFGGHLGTHARQCELGLDSTPRLRLAPQDMAPFEVTLSWAHDGVLAPLKDCLSLAIGASNASLEDFTWSELERDGRPRFFGVRPRDEVRQREVLLGLLQTAERHGAQLLVLPELSLSEGLLRDVRAWFEQPGRRLRLLVAGSLHLEKEGRRLNRCTTLLRGGGSVSHDKMRPFALPGPDGEPRVEDITVTPKRLTVHLSGSWSFVSLVCKDFITRELVELLAALRVRLVLVPAMTTRLDAFEGFAAYLASAAQSLVLVANVPGAPGASPCALAALPLRERLDSPPLAPPCLLSVQVSGGSVLTGVLSLS